jgi:hypothetical protein
MTKVTKALIVSMTLCGLASTSGAHHSVAAQFDPAKSVTLSGELVKFELINPHSYMHLKAKGADGQEQLWSIECAAPIALRRAGIPVKEAFVVGKTYTLTMHPSRDGSTTGLMNTITLQDGRVVGFGTANSLAGK